MINSTASLGTMEAPLKVEQINKGDRQTVINNESGVVNVGQVREYTELVTENSLHVYNEVTSESQGKFIVSFILACVVPALGLAADLMQVHPALSLPLWIYLAVFVIVMFCVLISFYDNFQILRAKRPKDDECRHLYGDKLFCITDEGYKIFTHTSPCIYPDCAGMINISSPPQRYNGNYSFFGKCSLAGGQHSYGIDYNFKAYPINVDWRIEEPENSKN